MKENKPKNRFEVLLVNNLSLADRVRILRDRVTGIIYLQTIYGNGTGITPFLK